MPVCAAAENVENVLAGPSVYVRQDGPRSLENCEYVLQNGPEYVDMVAAQTAMNGMFLPLALVVIFVLGWIAGAQR